MLEVEPTGQCGSMAISSGQKRFLSLKPAQHVGNISKTKRNLATVTISHSSQSALSN